MLSVLLLSIRETDVIGWYKDRAIVGVMFTGLPRDEKSSILSVILNKVSTALQGATALRTTQSSEDLLPLLSR